MYYRIVEKRKSQILMTSINFSISETQKLIYNEILPNYSKTFNYKLNWNLLPVKSKPHIAAYLQTNMCSFCNSSEETVSHLFLACVKLNSVWDFIIHLIFELTGYTVSMMTSNFFLFFDFSFLNIVKNKLMPLFFIKYYEALKLGSQKSNSSRRNRIQFRLHDQKNTTHDYFSASCREKP